MYEYRTELEKDIERESKEVQKNQDDYYDKGNEGVNF